MRINHRQAAVQHPLAHHLLTLGAFSHMERRGIYHRQQLRPGLRGFTGRRFKPGVLTNQQAHFDPAASVAGLKNANFLAGREVAAFIKHLVIGQLTLEIGRHYRAFTQHTGCVVPMRHRHRTGTSVVTGRMAHHHRQIF